MQVNEIRLEGANRSIAFFPGLNIITGPIASGKTTLVRYLRFLLGSSLKRPPSEARRNVFAVTGSLELADRTYLVMRPAVTTRNARVEIAGGDETWRLPASESPDGNTYLNWLLARLNLPRIAVPSAPTRPDSDPTPVSINDYLLYSYLAQNELGFSVFGHHDTHKNIKRKYVFDITYGFYDLDTARIQERIREVQGQLREIRSRQALFDTFFEGTELENRVRIEHELKEVEDELGRVEGEVLALAEVPRKTEDTAQLQSEILELENLSAQLRAAIDAEKRSLSNLEELAKQLEAQSGKLTRSVVSHKHLTDLEFVVCPRCGSELASSRQAEDACYLCLQEPSLEFSREILISELGAVEQQLSETQDLFREREARTVVLERQLEESGGELVKKRQDLDFQTKSYVSEQAAIIAAASAQRARLYAESEKLKEYLNVLAKLDDAQLLETQLKFERDSLQQELEAALAETADSYHKVDHLKSRFNEILERLRPPKFGEKESSDIDRNTYLPVYYGRPFAEVSSPGLATLINVSHALAHHLTAYELNLKLPQILIIDGLSEHLGHEGLDPQRLEAIYDLLIEISSTHAEIQVIVVDNEVPERARPYVRLELSEDDRLIRSSQE
ncbi:MAG: hypothetical protein F4X41_09870 [Chloroflexi bacterium]|nr:hypothetical protein [Chloroflexota bacterium]